MTDELFAHSLQSLIVEVKALREEMHDSRKEMGAFREEFVKLRERTDPVVEWFWKAIGIVATALIVALLALVLKGGK